MHDFLFSLWFFLPGGIANVTPILVAKAPVLDRWRTPLDFGHSWRGHRLFGDNKTWRGLICGSLMGLLVFWLQTVLYRHTSWAVTISQPLNYAQLPMFELGLALGFGAVLGDAIESFFKRQLNVSSGRSWFPFDQLDYIVGGLLLSRLVVGLPAVYYLWIIIVWFGMHLLFSYLGYLLKLKDQPI